MGDALKNCGRDILFYMCEWGIRDPWLWGSEVGGTCWRISYDSRENWDAGRHDGSNCGASQGIDIMKQIGHYAGVNRYNDGDIEIYMKDLENGDIALAVLNRGTTTRNVKLDLPDYYLVAGKKYFVRDLWAHDYVETNGDSFTTRVASHETKVFRVSENDLTGIGAPAAGNKPEVSVKAVAG